MTDALADSGMALSPFLYGGAGVAVVAIAGLYLLFRRKVRLQLKRTSLQKAYSSQTLEQPAVNLGNSAAPPGTVEEPQESLTPEDDGQLIGETEEQLAPELAAMFRTAEPSSSDDDDDTEKESEPVADKPQKEPESDKKDSADESQKQQPGGDTMLDLFTAEVTEDSNIGKLAASLDNVELEDIMGEAQSLIKKLKGDR
jgi:hypothetical protein